MNFYYGCEYDAGAIKKMSEKYSVLEITNIDSQINKLYDRIDKIEQNNRSSTLAREINLFRDYNNHYDLIVRFSKILHHFKKNRCIDNYIDQIKRRNVIEKFNKKLDQFIRINTKNGKIRCMSAISMSCAGCEMCMSKKPVKDINCHCRYCY